MWRAATGFREGWAGELWPSKGGICNRRQHLALGGEAVRALALGVQHLHCEDVACGGEGEVGQAEAAAERVVFGRGEEERHAADAQVAIAVVVSRE